LSLKMCAFYFGVRNFDSNSENSPIIENVEKIFDLQNLKVKKILKNKTKNSNKELLTLIKIEKRDFEFDFNLKPVIFEKFDKLKHCLGNFAELESFTSRKALKQGEKSVQNLTVEKIRLNGKQVFLVTPANRVNFENGSYCNGVQTVNTLFDSIKNYKNFTFYVLQRKYNPYYGNFFNYTAEVDGFFEGRPIEFKSFYLNLTNIKLQTFSRWDLIHVLLTFKIKVSIGVQCKRAGVEDVIIGLHNGKKMRLEHFYLSEVIKGAQSKIDAAIDKQDKNFAEAIIISWQKSF
jgi:hypothetical protein